MVSSSGDQKKSYTFYKSCCLLTLFIDVDVVHCLGRCLSGTVLGMVPEDLRTRPVDFSIRMVTKPFTDEEAFTKIYEKGLFGTEIRSGGGSEFAFPTEIVGTLHTIINYLQRILNKEKITMLDIQCGNMTWMSRFFVSRDDIIYTGMDIIPAIIEKHKKTFENTSHTFINANIVKVSV